MSGKQVLRVSEKFFVCVLALILAVNTAALAFAEEEQSLPPTAIDDVYVDDDDVIHWPTSLVLPALGDEYATDNIMVVFKRNITVNQAYAALEDVGLFDIAKEEFTITQEIIDKQLVYSAYLKEGVTVSDAITKVFAHPDIDWAEANGFARLDSDINVEEASVPEYIPQDPLASYEISNAASEVNKPIDKAANLLDPTHQTAALPATADTLSLVVAPTVLMVVASVALIITGIQIRRRRLR